MVLSQIRDIARSLCQFIGHAVTRQDITIRRLKRLKSYDNLFRFRAVTLLEVRLS